MGIISNSVDFFGLDIGTSELRVVAVKGGGNTLVAYGSLPIDIKTAQSDAPADLQKLAQAVKQLLGQTKIPTNNVAVGLPASKTFMTVVDIDNLDPKELDSSIRLQADSLLPTSLSESKMDWSLLGPSPKDPAKVEILLGSVPNSFVEKRLDLLESIGLNVIAFEPDSLALTRALMASNVNEPRLILDVGDESTDLVITMNNSPRLIRSIPIGTNALIKSAMQNLGIDRSQAEQFVFKFGMSQDKLEGQIYNAIHGIVDNLIIEIEKSLKFFTTRYQGSAVTGMILAGGASILPEFPIMLANQFKVNVEIGNSWRNISFNAAQQNELMAASNRFAVAAGLAERKEK